jgi:hypothetical protein
LLDRVFRLDRIAKKQTAQRTDHPVVLLVETADLERGCLTAIQAALLVARGKNPFSGGHQQV